MDTFQTVISPDVVDVLRHEHEQIQQLCTDVRNAGPDRKKHQFTTLRHAVHLHQIGELRVAHPAARNSGTDGDAIALSIQANGEQLERSLSELGRLGVAHPDFDAGFDTLAGAMHDHATRQERDEFPLLRRHVPTQRLHMMASAMHDLRLMADD